MSKLGVQILALKVPITSAADDKFCDIFAYFRIKQGIIFHENHLPAEDSHEMSFRIVIFDKAAKF